MFELSNIVVFREKFLDNGKKAFEWFRVANEDEDGHIAIEYILSEEEHLELLMQD